ncbi:MAG: cephalosporin hydroxylase [Desulfamplus sp.]|nr:cephalosporin hydroxylase [Desulfamplus sp.]
MTDKKILTRKEFEKVREESAIRMAQDDKLGKDALDLLVRADKHSWIHQTTWFGEPVLNLPQDMFAIQEIIFRTQPDYLIELGVAWGGSLLFYSTIMEAIGKGKVIGVDIYIPDDLRERLFSHDRISQRITLINGSSIDEKIYDTVKSHIGDSKAVMLILDSFHSHEHVLKELHMYSKLIGKNFYIVCSDTIIEKIPEQTHRVRPWGTGNNPKTALDEFMRINSRFKTDMKINNKLLLSCNPEGYIVCTKDTD